MLEPKHFLVRTDARKLWRLVAFFMFVEVFLLRIYFLSVLVFLSSYLLSASGLSACTIAHKNERLFTHCLLNSSLNKSVEPATAYFLNTKLRRNVQPGIATLPVAERSLQRFLAPVILYSHNINGGNPNAALVLGDMVFQGKADRVKKAGVLMGVGAGLRDRYFPHARTYFEYGVSAHYAHSPQHKMGIASLSADACFVKSLRNWRYVDLCTRADRIQKDLSDTRIKQHEIRVSKLWNGKFAQSHQFTAGVAVRNADQSVQTQILVEMEMLYSTNRIWSLRIIRGERVPNRLVLTQIVSLSLVELIKQNPFALDLSYSEYSGGGLLGYKRDDSTLSALLSYPVSPQVSLSFGYQFTNSTIDYFDLKTPILALKFQALRF